MTTKMHINKLSLISLAAIGALMGSTAAHAQATAPMQNDSYYYFGVGGGQARARIDDNRIANSLIGSGFTTSAISHDERESAYKVFLGYQFNRYVGMELGYFHLGQFGFGATTVPAGSLTGSFRTQGANIDVVGTLPFTENFSGLARIGGQFARTLTHMDTTGAVRVANNVPSDRETNVKVGLGLQYAFSPSVMMRGEVERYRISDAVGNHPQIATYSVSLVFPFGRTESGSRRAMMQPAAYVAPVAQAPASPAPMMAPREVAVAPMPAATPMAAFAPQRVSYAAESFFAFDRTELKPEGKTALDTFVGQLKGSSYDTITVQGYADRLGATAYNQTLSLARAESVKAYLVNSGQLEGTKIATVGKGELEPVTLPDACKGAMSERVIACLQPDRRVEIEVSGTR
jgi:OOP family OmpA-OmpF porin